MAEFLIAFGWGLAVLAAFWGWGAVAMGFVSRRAGARGETSAEALLEMPAWGIAFSVAAGGVLNLLCLANRDLLCVYVISGAAIACAAARAAWRGRSLFLRGLQLDLPGLMMVLAVVVLLAFRLAGSVITPSFIVPGVAFNPHDDTHSYLVSVQRLLQTGSVGEDPFNSRQIANALGGEHFLNALTIAPIALDHIHMLEAGLALVALSCASGAMGLRIARDDHGGSSVVIAAGMMLLPLLIAWPFRNLSSLVTGAVALLLLAMSMHQAMQARETGKPAARWLWLVGLALAAACSLKSTWIPVACFAAAAAFVMEGIRIRSVRVVGDGLLAGAIALGLMLPWMIWQYRSSGTLLYPILGRGCYVDVASSIPVPSLAPDLKRTAALAALLPLCLLMVMGVAFCSREIRVAAGGPLVAVVLAFLAGWVVDCLVLVQVTDMPDISRYVAGAQAVGIALMLATWWRIAEPLARQIRVASARSIRAVGLLSVIACTAPQWTTMYLIDLPESLRASVAGKLTLETAPADLRAMQNTIPAGQTFLAYLSTPAMLDFRRNRIYVADWPGESSPPPGMPLQRGPEAIADYLLKQGIRYVAYSYVEEANFPRHPNSAYVSPRFGRVLGRQAAESFAFQDAMVELAHTRRRIFDDGVNFVLDLATPNDRTARIAGAESP